MKIRAVLIGTTKVNPQRYGGWTGECPGCDKDVLALLGILAPHNEAERVYLLRDEVATIANVANAIDYARMGLDHDDLLVLFRSGHGGQTADLDGDEADGKDETHCLFDGQVTDDHLWGELLKQPMGCRDPRIITIIDACHSESSWRGAPQPPAAKREGPAPQMRMLVMSGCADDKVSWGDASGGKFTRALAAAYKPGITYRQWFADASQKMGSGQVPKMTIVNGFNADAEVFT